MNNFEEVLENEAIVVLTKAEAVLMKRIREMRDGKPKYAASERLNELREALRVLKVIEGGGVVVSEGTDIVE
jgi:hypothetical protein